MGNRQLQGEGEPMPLGLKFQSFHRFHKFQVVKLSETIGTTGTNRTFGTRVWRQRADFQKERRC